MPHVVTKRELRDIANDSIGFNKTIFSQILQRISTHFSNQARVILKSTPYRDSLEINVPIKISSFVLDATLHDYYINAVKDYINNSTEWHIKEIKYIEDEKVYTFVIIGNVPF